MRSSPRGKNVCVNHGYYIFDSSSLLDRDYVDRKYSEPRKCHGALVCVGLFHDCFPFMLVPSFYNRMMDCLTFVVHCILTLASYQHLWCGRGDFWGGLGAWCPIKLGGKVWNGWLEVFQAWFGVSFNRAKKSLELLPRLWDRQAIICLYVGLVAILGCFMQAEDSVTITARKGFCQALGSGLGNWRRTGLDNWGLGN